VRLALEYSDGKVTLHSTFKGLKPKPGFPLAPGQRHLGPLILDTEQKYMVPAAINTYLREYQRDGVRFFWRQYKEGRGGLLGDDMGLVRFRLLIQFN
jgi:hypothetical protein